MIGMNPQQSLFGLNPLAAQLGQQQPAQPAMGNPAPQPAQAFVYGAGGARMTPQQLAAKQAIATQLSRSDYSPVSSVWQGLGRVVDNVRGALDQKKIDKEQAAQNVDRQSILAALTGGAPGSQPGAVQAALGSSDPVLQSLGTKAWEMANPKPINNDTANDFNFYSQQLGPEAGQKFLQNQLDPIVTIPLPGGQGTYVGPRSGMSSALGGGGPVSSPSGGGAMPPSTLPPDFDFGGPTQPASGGFPR